MNSKVKIIIAVVFFALAGLVLAYQFGLFGSKTPAAKKESAVVPTGPDQPPPAGLSGPKPGG